MLHRNTTTKSLFVRGWTGPTRSQQKAKKLIESSNREYLMREHFNQIGWSLARHSDISVKMIGYKIAASSHYFRSLEAAPDGHPSFEEYMKHWIGALGKGTQMGQIEPEVFDALRELYPAPDIQRMSPGHSYWNT